MATCSLNPDDVWFTEYRPDKVRMKSTHTITGIEIRDKNGNLILGDDTHRDPNVWHVFDLTWYGPSNNSQNDIDYIYVYNMEMGGVAYLSGLEFGPQQPTQHPV